MSAATLDAPEPDNEQVTAFAALILRTVPNAKAVQAKDLAKRLVAGGARVDLADQSDVSQAFEQILSEDTEVLDHAEIARLAHNERVARLQATAKHSASQLVPSPSDHAIIDRLLEEL